MHIGTQGKCMGDIEIKHDADGSMHTENNISVRSL